MKAALVALSFPVLLTITALSCWYDARAVLILVFFVVLVAVQAATRRQGEIEHLPTIVTGPATGETLFFIHGWPDNASMWDAQVHHMSGKGYRCVTLTLPHFSGRGDPGGAAVPWGYSFEELAELCGRTLSKSLGEAGQKAGTLVIHDWGCYVGFYLQRLHPDLVKRIVAMDVGTPPLKGQRLDFAPVMAVAGLVYQYWLAMAFALSASLPVVGQPVGDAMTRFAIANIGDNHHRGPNAIAGFSASMNYLYFWFHVNYWLEILGLRAAFHKRYPATVEDGSRRFRVPTLFFYGSDKGFKFHGENWEKTLVEDPGCKVVPMPSFAEQMLADHGGPKLKSIGHWVMLRDAPTVNYEIEEWLGQVQT